MSLYEKFLLFEAVVSIKNNNEYVEFCALMKKLGLGSIKYLSRMSFEDLHKNAGIQVIPYGKLCIEFQLGKGFTVDTTQNYLEYGVEVISFDKLLSEITAVLQED